MPLVDRVPGGCHSCRADTSSAAIMRITSVLRNVARSELISETPTLPNTAVSAAKNADATANTRQSKFMAVRSSMPIHDSFGALEQLRRDALPGGRGIFIHLFGPRCPDDRRSHVRLPQHPGQDELRQGQTCLRRKRSQVLNGPQNLRLQPLLIDEAVDRFIGGAAIRRNLRSR